MIPSPTMPMSYKISNKFLDAEQIIFSWSIYLNIRPIKTYHTEKLQEKRNKKQDSININENND